MADDQSETGAAPSSGEAEQMASRRAKLAQLRRAGFSFPNDFRRSRENDGSEHDSAILVERYGHHDKQALEQLDCRPSLAGRLVNRRGPFLVIQDGAGQIQLYLHKRAPEALRAEVESWDIGDIVAGAGRLEKSGKGALYVNLERAWLLTKALRPLPDQYYGLADPELRHRRRYLDLIVNAETRRVFELRSRIVDALRDCLRGWGFMEVETPMMQPIPGGAAARPFVTHHNALETDLYLRVAPELYLKRLVVGGFERVFEINRNFRNEGLSTKHNPEFTMLEFYQAYADHHGLMDLIETLLRTLTQRVLGTTSVTYQGERIDFGEPIARLSVREALIQRAGLEAAIVDDRDALAGFAANSGLDVDADWGGGRLRFELFEAFVEERLMQPVFITEYPTEVSPLARRSAADPEVTDRFELFAMGREIANGFAELNDSEDQAERFHQQLARKDAGDEDAMHYDADYIRALEYGMPPTAGAGIGVDRLTMLLTDRSSIREVLLFPHLRPLEA